MCVCVCVRACVSVRVSDGKYVIVFFASHSLQGLKLIGLKDSVYWLAWSVSGTCTPVFHVTVT